MNGKPLQIFVGHRFTDTYMIQFRPAIEEAFKNCKVGLFELIYGDSEYKSGQIFKDKVQEYINNLIICILI